MRIGVDDSLQLPFAGPVPAIAVRVETPHQPLVGAADILPPGIVAQAENAQCPGIAFARPVPCCRRRLAIAAEQVVRIGEMECLAAAATACRTFPAGERRGGGLDFLGAQPVEEIVAGVESADMIEAQELPAAFVTGQAIRLRRAKFARRRAAGVSASVVTIDAAVKTLRPPGRIGRNGGRSCWAMRGFASIDTGQHRESADMGKIAAEIERRLAAALAPQALEITDDSDEHRGHAGHRGDGDGDGDGESHFTVSIVADAFAGQSRVARQRLVYAALGDLVAPDRIHALIIRARAPGEA